MEEAGQTDRQTDGELVIKSCGQSWKRLDTKPSDRQTDRQDGQWTIISLMSLFRLIGLCTYTAQMNVVLSFIYPMG